MWGISAAPTGNKEEVEATDYEWMTPMGYERTTPFTRVDPMKDNNNTLAITGHPFYPGGPYEGQQQYFRNNNPINLNGL